MAKVQPRAADRILDVGGYPGNWKDVATNAKIITLNVEAAPGTEQIDSIAGDATDLPYADGAFDIVFSNSVIEHVGTWRRQQEFASEARRVGRKLWIQTPARVFPIEPHYIAPFIHWLPLKLRRRLIRNFTVYGWLHRPNQEQIEVLLNEIRLLSKQELQALFPDCTILVERWLGLPKSYVALRT